MTDDRPSDGNQPDPALFATIHHKSERRPDGYTDEDITELNRLANGRAALTSAKRPLWLTGGAAAIILVLTGGAIWLSPTWTPDQVARAARVSDNSKLEELIDFYSIQNSIQQMLFSLSMEHDNPMDLSPSDLAPIYKMASQIGASEIAQPSQVINLFVDRPVIASIGPGVDLRGAFRTSQGQSPLYKYSRGYVNWNTYSWRATKIDDPGTTFTVYAKRKGLGWRIISINGQTTGPVYEAFTEKRQRQDTKTSHYMNDEIPIEAQPLSVTIAQETKTEELDISDEVPIFCRDDTQTFQPLVRTNYGRLKQSFSRQFGWQSSLTATSGSLGRLIFSETGRREAAETIIYDVQPHEGGIALLHMHVSLDGKSENPSGTEMCGVTWGIVNVQ